MANAAATNAACRARRLQERPSAEGWDPLTRSTQRSRPTPTARPAAHMRGSSALSTCLRPSEMLQFALRAGMETGDEAKERAE